MVGLLINQVLVIPAALRRSSNWKQPTGDDSQFDSRQVLNQLIGETIHYGPNPKMTAVVVSDSKVLFEGKEWSLSPLTRELKQRDGQISPASQFHGPTYWSWDDTRLIDLEI